MINLELDFTPILWVKELHYEKFNWNLQSRLKINRRYGDYIQSQIYLLQEALGVNLDLDFYLRDRVHSGALNGLITRAVDPMPHEKNYLENHHLEETDLQKIDSLKSLTQAPENWAGRRCEPVWVEGVADVLYVVRETKPIPTENYQERVTTITSQLLPELPKPMIQAAYDRLHDFGTFK